MATRRVRVEEPTSDALGRDDDEDEAEGADIGIPPEKPGRFKAAPAMFMDFPKLPGAFRDMCWPARARPRVE